MKKSILIIAVAATTITACNNNQSASENHEGQVADTTTAANEEEIKIITHQFTTLDANVAKHINAIIENYLMIKDNLVKSDAGASAKSAADLKKLSEGFDESLLTDEQKAIYDKCVPGLQKQASAISEEKSIDKQREVFASLTAGVYEMTKAFGYTKSLFNQYCPMALNEKGGMWLSAEADIKNPYFGDEMLECGSVTEEIK